MSIYNVHKVSRVESEDWGAKYDAEEHQVHSGKNTFYGTWYLSIVVLVWQTDRRCLGPPEVFGDGRFHRTMQNVVGPTLVAMATKFGLGTEIQSPTGLFQMFTSSIGMVAVVCTDCTPLIPYQHYSRRALVVNSPAKKQWKLPKCIYIY